MWWNNFCSVPSHNGLIVLECRRKTDERPSHLLRLSCSHIGPWRSGLLQFIHCASGSQGLWICYFLFPGCLPHLSLPVLQVLVQMSSPQTDLACHATYSRFYNPHSVLQHFIWWTRGIYKNLHYLFTWLLRISLIMAWIPWGSIHGYLVYGCSYLT